jgi:hypothetical protein
MTDNFLASRAQRLIDEFEEGETVAGGIARVLEHLAYAFDMVCDGEGESMVGVPVSTLDQLAVELRNAPQPEPEGPSDEELLAVAAGAINPYETCGIAIGEYEAETECAIEVYGSELIAFARAVLAGWGNL